MPGGLPDEGDHLPGEGLPRYVNDGEARCILCGHLRIDLPDRGLEVGAPQLDPTRYPEVSTPLPTSSAITCAYGLVRRFRPEPVDGAVLPRYSTSSVTPPAEPTASACNGW